MANLTYQWTVYGSATLYNNISVNLVGCLFSQDTNANQSVVSFALVSSGSYWRTSNGTASFTGDFTDSQSCATYPNYIYNEDTIFRIEKTITHDANGYKSINVGGIINAYINGANRNATINQINFVIPQIKRQSMWASSLLSISNIENAFTLPITKYVGSYYNVVEIRNNNGSILVKTINDANDGQLISFTSSEINTITTLDENRNNKNQRFYMHLKTYTDSSKTTQIGTTQVLLCDAFLPNPNPTATYTLEEKDAGVIAFLGSSSANKIIKNASDLAFAITPTTTYNAYVKSVTVNDIYATNDNGVYKLNINNAIDSTFKIKVIDTRDYDREYTITKTPIDYIALNYYSWSIERVNPTSSDLKLNANIDCFSSTIDGTQNTPTVQYSIDNSTWSTISSSDYTFANNKIIISNITLENIIDYQTTGTFYLKCTDLLSSYQDNRQISKGIETFSYSEDDFQINGDLFVADSNGENAVNVMSRINTINTNLSTRIQGYGEICKSVVGNNWNTICGTKSGFYMGDRMSNGPTNGWVYLIHLAHNNLYQKQIAFDFFSNSVYTRIMDQGTWQNWVQLH